MLSKTHRLTRKDVSGVLAKSVYSTSPHFSLRFREKSDEISGFSVVVSKKVEKTASGRNRLKRRVYEIVQTLLPRHNKGVQGIIFARKGANALSFKELEKEITSLLTKARIVSR